MTEPENAQQGVEAWEKSVKDAERALAAKVPKLDNKFTPLDFLSVEQLTRYIQKEVEFRENLATCKTCKDRRKFLIEASLQRTKMLQQALDSKSVG